MPGGRPFGLPECPLAKRPFAFRGEVLTALLACAHARGGIGSGPNASNSSILLSESRAEQADCRPAAISDIQKRSRAVWLMLLFCSNGVRFQEPVPQKSEGSPFARAGAAQVRRTENH